MEGNKLSSVQKVWISGSTLVVSIPRNIREVLNIHKGDHLEVDWGDVIKRVEIKEKKVKKEDILDSDYLPKL